MTLPPPSPPDARTSDLSSISSASLPAASWQRTFLAAGATLGAAVFLAEAYGWAAGVVGGNGWLGAALLNSLLALIVLVWALMRDTRRAQLFALKNFHGRGPAWLARTPGLVYLPALLVLLGSMLLSAGGRILGGTSALHLDGLAQTAFILWIPLIEELVFRAGAGKLYRRHVGGFVGMWFAALLFALAHAAPTFSNVLQLNVGLPLGPFLLGIVCEILIAWTGSIVPALALHAACNATVVIFALGDARFLDWFGALYS